jgi:predicted small lipoprotein YifL
MHCFSPFVRSSPSFAVIAFLSLVLLGCGNAPVGARQTPGQTADSVPPRWTPRPIQAPRPVIVDSAVKDSTATDSSGVPAAVGSTKAGTAGADTIKADSSKVDTVKRDNTKLVKTPAVLPKTKRNPFPLTARDSARWPVPGPPELPGSILPSHRIVAFFGNPLSKRMGILGEIETDEMLRRLDSTAWEWARLDPERKVFPALHQIATVAQGYPGPGRKSPLQMPDSIIEKVASWAEQKGWLLFLDVQLGTSTIEKELPSLVKYLSRPYVHLALDPEFAMKDGKVPGTDWMGRMDAVEVNHAIDVLTRVVDEYQLPPKVLVVHRFTRNMLTNARHIKLDPRVQVVINMDGWGPPSSKRAAYKWFVVQVPVQYTGWKLFYKNDKPIMTPQEVLEVYPKPVYIQYQ